MRLPRRSRRTVLRSLGGLAALSGLPATVRAHPGDSGDDGTDTAATGTAGTSGFAPRGSLTVDGTVDGVVSDDAVYVAATDGFAVVDVSDPTDPRLLAERRGILADRDGGPLGQIYDAAVDGDRLLVAGPAHPPGGDALTGAALYDVSDPADPAFVRFHETSYPVHNCFLRDGVAFLTGNDGERNPLVLVDVTRDPPAELARWSVLDANAGWRDVPPDLRVIHDVTVDGGIATLAYWDAGTWLLDVSDPTDPRPLGHRSRYDPSDLASADTGEAFRLPGNAHYAQRRGDLLAVGREAWDLDPGDGRDGGPGGIDLYDVGDVRSTARGTAAGGTGETGGDRSPIATIAPPPTSDPTYEGVWTTAHNFDLAGDRLYASWYRGGVTVHDVRDPASPRELARFRDADRFAFWTARRADACAVATSWRGPSGNTAEGVYTFAPRERTEAAGATESGASMPGFGVGAVLAGLGAGAAAEWRRDRDPPR